MYNGDHMSKRIDTNDSLISPLNEPFIILMLTETFLLAKLPETNVKSRPSNYVQLPGIGQKALWVFSKLIAQRRIS